MKVVFNKKHICDSLQNLYELKKHILAFFKSLDVYHNNESKYSF